MSYYISKVVVASDLLTIPALGTYNPTLSSTTTGANVSQSFITVASGDLDYVSPGAILEVGGSQIVVSNASGTSINWVAQAPLTTGSGDPYTLYQNGSLLGPVVSYGSLILFDGAYVTGSMNWSNQLKDAVIQITSGAAAGSICQIRTYDPVSYRAILYTNLDVLPARGDRWTILACNVSASSASPGTLTLASSLDKQLILSFPVNSLLVGVSNSSGSNRGVANVLTGATLASVTTTSAPGFNDAGPFIVRVCNGAYPVSLSGSQMLIDGGSFKNSELCLMLPESDGTFFNIYVAQLDDVYGPSKSYANNSGQLTLLPQTIAASELCVPNSINKKYTGWWLENYQSPEVVNLQFTSTYFYESI